MGLNSTSHKRINSSHKKNSDHLLAAHFRTGAAPDRTLPVLPGEKPRRLCEDPYLFINQLSNTALFFLTIFQSTHPAALNHHFPPVLPTKGGMFDVTARAPAFRERRL